MFHSGPLLIRDRRVSYDGRTSYSSFGRPGFRCNFEAIGMKRQMTFMGKTPEERWWDGHEKEQRGLPLYILDGAVAA